ncbi:MAG: (d)CMP kinase, partial [Caldimicrobium sp.]
TTVAKALAQRFNLSLLESGAFYRTITLAFKERGINIRNFAHDEEFKEKIKEILSKIETRITPFGTEIIFEGRLLHGELRSKEVEETVSEISAHPLIREVITNYLRGLVKGKRIITEGRDMGSVVFPEAQLKFFLTADLLERARRRAKDFPERTLEEIKENLQIRDQKDSERKVSPL